jgi:S-adenosylmethionine:tRNA ribosyltransferase-isomerase
VVIAGNNTNNNPSDEDPDRRLSSYQFNLPDDLIAQQPLEPRHRARMLAVQADGSCRDLKVWDLVDQLQKDDLIIVNNTRVLRARLEVKTAGGANVELLVLEPWPAGVGQWLCLAKPAKKLKPGDWLELITPQQSPLALQVLAIHPETGGRILQFPPECIDAVSLEPLLLRYGTIPLPPYIREHRDSDNERYQTIFASAPGAVAAPTAGLHLSDRLLKELSDRGIRFASITLHVGLGTFRPVEIEDLSKLRLHSEWVEITTDLVQAVKTCKQNGGRIIAIGTTSVRSLEAVAQLNNGVLKPHRGPVNLVIQPGYKFLIVEGLLTNFHLPKSSLLLLVSALLGREQLLAIYGEAVMRKYRFFSYGDAMWIPPEAVLR